MAFEYQLKKRLKMIPSAMNTPISAPNTRKQIAEIDSCSTFFSARNSRIQRWIIKELASIYRISDFEWELRSKLCVANLLMTRFRIAHHGRIEVFKTSPNPRCTRWNRKIIVPQIPQPARTRSPRNIPLLIGNSFNERIDSLDQIII